MGICQRMFTDSSRYGEDYHRIHTFLRYTNEKDLVTPNFTWERWEWMIGHSNLDLSALEKIGVWEEDGHIISFVTYEGKLGEAFFCIDAAHAVDLHLKGEMLRYACSNLCTGEGELRVIIDDGDRQMQRLALEQGFYATQKKEYVSALDIDQRLKPALPEGFKFHSKDEGWDFRRYHQVMWRGFHQDEGEPVYSKEILEARQIMLSGPNLRPELVLAVVAPDGDYASHCVMWYQPGDRYAYIEPVATDSRYRRLGLGKAVVWEAARRSGLLGATEAIVGSNQQFYYSIGFAPIHSETWWQRG